MPTNNVTKYLKFANVQMANTSNTRGQQQHQGSESNCFQPIAI
jgi:hypothetical protein